MPFPFSPRVGIPAQGYTATQGQCVCLCVCVCVCVCVCLNVAVVYLYFRSEHSACLLNVDVRFICVQTLHMWAKGMLADVGIVWCTQYLSAGREGMLAHQRKRVTETWRHGDPAVSMCIAFTDACTPTPTLILIPIPTLARTRTIGEHMFHGQPKCSGLMLCQAHTLAVL